MRFLFLLLFFLLAVRPVFSDRVSFAEARNVALGWVDILNTGFKDKVALGDGERLVRRGIVAGYVFHFVPAGYVLIAAEDYLPPIKLYSLKNDFGREGRELEEQVLGGFCSLIRRVREKEIDPESYFMGSNRENFARLRAERRQASPLSSSVPIEDMAPMLRSTWNQGDPYNQLCPTINGRKPPCGCVATAFAQILNYHRYPASGRGAHSYSWRGTTLSADFNHAYRWDQMLPDYDGAAATAEQKTAVARLMYDLGVAFEMDYNLLGSGAYATDALTVLPDHFQYSSDIRAIEHHEVARDDDWFNIARQQLDNGLPVAFSIYTEDSGHEVVIDGYRISQGATSFHINLGWGGTYDGYFSLNNILDFNKNEWQIFVYNIHPPGYRAVQPPLNAVGEAHLNESLFFSEYYCRIAWEASPNGDGDLSRYAVLRKDGLGNVTTLGEVPPQDKEFVFRTADFAPFTYAVVAVDRSDRQSPARYFSLELR